MSRAIGITVSGALLSQIDKASPLFAQLLSASAKLAKKDVNLWGQAAATEARVRLNWLNLPISSRDLLPQLDALTAWAREKKLTKVLICGMGGSSLAPEVIAKTFQKELIVVDTTDPEQIANVLKTELKETIVVVGSKSGSTIETASLFALFKSRFEGAKLDPLDHLVIVTDPGSPLDLSARAAGFRVINADPNVGGRFSALSAFGLVPAALIGVDVSVLIDDALEAQAEFLNSDSPAIKIAYLLTQPDFAFTAFSDQGSAVPGLSDWIEQLVAESTGKDQKGILPIVITNPNSAIGGKHPLITFDGTGELSVVGSIGAHFIFWEWVTALLCVALKVDAFNQPNVTEAKSQTSTLLTRWADAGPQSSAPTLSDDNIDIYSEKTFSTISQYLIDAISERGYIAIMAYLNRIADYEVSAIRELLAKKSNTPTTFGWGPRFLHSTGQFHKGGPQVGSFIQITGESRSDIEIPDQSFGFQTLIMAQALGDGEALQKRKFPLLRIHLRERKNGISQLLAIVNSL
ncbi:unannotated protein [freshwater metagenome]|uniref:Unannotated protein n=1 Tax=freshwater metagenome TaxID=449393 RepID=A0A6J7M4I2_9ZZZZ